MANHIGIAVTGVLVTGLCWLTSAHDTIPDKLWPLTNYTNGREIMKGGEDLAIFPVRKYQNGEGRLGYNALDLTDNTVMVTLRKDVQYKFMLMAMFYINPESSQNQIFLYKYNSAQKFKIFLERCQLNIKGTLELITVDMKDDCPHGYGWYTVAIQWSGKMKVMMVYAHPSETKGKTVLEVEAKDAFDFDWVENPGNLTVGPVDGGRVCCLRVYQEEFDKGHIEDQMYEDCTEREFWKTAVSNPCRDTPCQSGGTCVVDVDSYTCLCRPWYTGVNCSVELSVTKLGFKLLGYANLTGRLDPMSGMEAISARSVVECSGRCLRENLCMSFTFGQKRCTLYRDVTMDFTDGPTQYFVERQINTNSIGQ